MNRSTSAKATISSNFRSISDLRNESRLQTSASDDVGKLLLHAPEVKHSAAEQHDDDDRRYENERARRFRLAEQGPAKTFHHANHRIESIKHAPASGNDRAGI